MTGSDIVDTLDDEIDLGGTNSVSVIIAREEDCWWGWGMIWEEIGNLTNLNDYHEYLRFRRESDVWLDILASLGREFLGEGNHVGDFIFGISTLRLSQSSCSRSFISIPSLSRLEYI